MKPIVSPSAITARLGRRDICNKKPEIKLVAFTKGKK
jgi:hypothetical protein